jgi:hypothetical protein
MGGGWQRIVVPLDGTPEVEADLLVLPSCFLSTTVIQRGRAGDYPYLSGRSRADALSPIMAMSRVVRAVTLGSTVGKLSTRWQSMLQWLPKGVIWKPSGLTDCSIPHKCGIATKSLHSLTWKPDRRRFRFILPASNVDHDPSPCHIPGVGGVMIATRIIEECVVCMNPTRWLGNPKTAILGFTAINGNGQRNRYPR